MRSIAILIVAALVVALAPPVAAGGPALVASFTVNVSHGTTPLTVQFTDTSSNTPTSWLWDFGDNTTSTAQNPVHTYTDAYGKYDVVLTASNAAGSDDVHHANTTMDYNHLWGGAPAHVDFVANVTSGTAPLYVRFDPVNCANNTQWTNWGVNATSGLMSGDPLQGLTARFDTPGVYDVSMGGSNWIGGYTGAMVTVGDGPTWTNKTGYITVTAPPLEGDYNGNGRVDFADVTGFYTALGTIPYRANLDLNRNGRLDYADVVALFSRL